MTDEVIKFCETQTVIFFFSFLENVECFIQTESRREWWVYIDSKQLEVKNIVSAS